MNQRRDLIVIGGGGHARVVIEAARSRPDLWNVLGFTDPEECPLTQQLLQVSRLGTDDAGLARANNALFVLGLGSTRVAPYRLAVARTYEEHGARWAVVVHAAAWVSPTAELAEGTVVGPGAVISAGACLGEHCLVNSGAVIEHDVRLGAGVQVAPRATIGGGAVIGRESYLGLGCLVRDHVEIGERVLVAMGAVVVGSVPTGQAVMGVPARPAAG